jgi:outer membrane protein OmpA-like peptidoglycan-associated protein
MGVAAGAALVLLMWPGIGLAQSSLTVVTAGEAYDGPPQFAVTFNGRPLGKGEVDTAIDAGKDGRFADAADKGKYVKSFAFSIPDDMFQPQGVVAIRLTNAGHGSDGAARELFVQSVTVNGEVLPATSFSMRSDAGVEPTAMLGDYLVVSDNAVEGIALPAGGWPEQAAATATPAPKVAEVVPAAAPVPATKPPTDAVVTTEAAASDAEDANPQPEANLPSCGLSKRFAITGFSRNSNDLTPKVMRTLDAVAKAIGTQRCVVHVTGYSSTEGDFAHNALFSIERSQKALHYLAAHGVKFRKFSANGVGETTQFGPNPSANRRVVVAVSP